MSGAAVGYCGVLLAAGRSTRFGSDKLLHALPDGKPMALASAAAMLAALPRVVAVVSADNAVLRRLLAAQGCEIAIAPATDIGMGWSLAAGVAANDDAAGWVVALADMPFIRAETIMRVQAALAAGAVLAAPVFNGRRGHPVGFDRRFRQALLALQGDEGARQLLRAHADEIELIPCSDEGILRDIDRPAAIGASAPTA